jgi:predicted AAA+ superfamily ATPase
MTSATYLEIKEYIELLEETYLISVLKPFYTNKNKELVKIPKIYFIDNGVRNYFIKNFNDLAIRNDAGFLFEGFIISELIKKGIKNLRFWQDKNKNEIDLIIDQETHQVPIEIKFKKNLKSDDYRGIKAIMKEYKKIRKTYLINLGIQKQNKNTTLILPYSLKKIIV